MSKETLDKHKVGYARVSTHEQNIDLQIDALSKEGCHKMALTQQLCSEVQDRRKNPLFMRVSRISKFHNIFSSGNNIKYTL